MSTDRTRDSSPQGDIPSTNLTEQLFGSYIDQTWVAAAVGGDAASWLGFRYKADKVAAMDPAHGHYQSIALIKHGATTRSDATFAGGRLVVADDVGAVMPDGVIPFAPGAEVDEALFDMFAPPTNYEVETSRGNFQKGYVIDPPEPSLARWKHFLDGMKRHPRFGPAFRKCTAVHYVRMETGRNQEKLDPATKKPTRPRFSSRLTKPYDGGSYTLDELAAHFGIDMGDEQAGSAPGTPLPKPTGETLSPEAVRKLLELIPNDDHYDTWIKVGHAVYGATEGSEEGREVFVEWSAQSPKHDTNQSTSATWDTLFAAKASASTLRKTIETMYGKDSPERQKAAQIFAAGGAFGVVEEDQIPMPGGTGDIEAKAAGKKLDELLAEIAKTQPVPDHHRNGDSANWTNGGKVQTLREALKSGTVAPPVIITPYERGILTVLAGMPGLGKSLLILNQALAITYNRPDLIRYGHGKLQFAGDIIYISNEDGKGLIKRRAQAWLDHHGLGSATPAHEIIPLKSALLNFDGKAWQVSCLEILEAVLEYVRSGRDIAMIVVDTMATSVTGINENAAQDISPVMAFLDRLAKAFWASVTFVHHVNKEAAAAGDRSIISIRGSTGITGAVRGALTLTAATAKEIEEFGWMGRQVIVEYVAKANDDKARYVACWYEQITVQIATQDAVDPAKTVMQETPILAPLVPTQSINDMAQVRAWRDLLEEAAAAGKQMRVYGSNVNNTGAKSVHRVLGVSVKKAAEIIEKMSNMGVITVEQVVDTDTGRKAPMVVIGGGFEVV